MASSSGAASSSATEFPVIVPKDLKKVFNILRFAGSADVPNLLKTRKLCMRREDNSRQQPQVAAPPDSKDAVPKTGAGSEFGKEERDERARRLRGGRTLRKYNPDEQPWIATFAPSQSSSSKDEKKPLIISGAKPRKFRGLREAGATENASWFVFAQRPDKSFIALPVDEWYGFTAMTGYEHLNSDEVEEEFQKRKKTLNLFTIMLQKRLKNQPDMEPEELKAQVKEEMGGGRGGRRGMHLTDLDAEWVDEDEEEGDDEGDGESKKEDGPKIADADAALELPTGKKKMSKKKFQELLRQKKRLRSKGGEDGAESDISDSDEGDFDGREVDYMTSSGAESELDDKEIPDEVKEELEEAETAERGVEDEDGLRKLNDSAAEDEEEEEEETKDSKDDDIDNEDKDSRSKQGLSSSESDKDESGRDDDSDSDIERYVSGRSTQSKRRMAGEVITASGKRIRLELPSDGVPAMGSSSSSTSGGAASAASRSSGGNDIDSQLEQAIKHYLSRTPMSATQLVEKFLQKARAASANGGGEPPSSQDLARRIAQIILRLKPEQIKTGNQVFFSLSPAQ